MDKISLLKQRYLKKYREEKAPINNIPDNTEELSKLTQTANNSNPGLKKVSQVRADF
jgi:hypothetical protein